MMILDTPLARACPVCQAQEGRLCTQPTENGRRQVQWFHLGRTEAE